MKLNERTNNPIEMDQRFKDSMFASLRVASPGIIQSVDYGKQTCVVKLAIKEKLNFEGEYQWMEIPPLLDVPIFVYSGGGYYLTLPVSPGDECLVVFGDNCMDAWWQSGGIQNQVERRRHDLSDGFAIVGFCSQPRAIGSYSSSSAQLRNADGSAVIEISGSQINIRSSNTTIDGKSFLGHKHGGVRAGGDNTGGVS